MTNWHVDLLPVAKAAEARLGLRALGVGSPSDGLFRWDADWVFLSREALEAPFVSNWVIHTAIRFLRIGAHSDLLE